MTSFEFLRSRALTFGCLFTLLTLSACDSLQSESGAVRTNLQFGAVRPAGSGAATASLTGETAVGVTVEEIKLLVKSVKFQSRNEDEIEFKTGPFVVAIDPQATAQTVAIGEIPAATYDRVTFHIHKPEESEPLADPEFRDGESGQQRYSMIIKGTYLDHPFTLKLRESFHQRVALNPPLVVNEGDQAVSVTLLADISSWFTGDDGLFLNPLAPGVLDEIEDAIEDSFRGLSTKRGGHDDSDDDDNGGDDDSDDGSGSDDDDDDEYEEDGVARG